MTGNSKNSPPILFIFLGASNLARGHYALANCLQRNLYPRPTQFMFALGPGRGYCAWGGLLNVVYSPIINSQIFSAVKKNERCKIVAVVTDIGNDIMYNVSPSDIKNCLRKIFKQLREFNALILTTPISSRLETELSEFSFFFLRSIFYPKSKVSYEQVVTGIHQINEFLKSYNKENIQMLTKLEEFFGWDKIHYSLLRGHHAWSRVVAQIMQTLHFNANTNIRCHEMLVSYGINIKQLITSDFFSLQNKGPEYF